MNKLQKLATCAALACATSIANASTITSATVYENTPDPGDASSSRNMTGGLDSANFTIGSAGINFLSSSGTTIATFLNNPTFSNQRHSFDPNAPLNSGSLGTEIVITGNPLVERRREHLCGGPWTMVWSSTLQALAMW